VSLFFLVGHGGQAGVGEMGGSGVDGGPAAMEQIQLGVVGSSVLVVNWRDGDGDATRPDPAR
jgi:hypothetical protein